MNAFVLLMIGGVALTVGDILFKFWVEKSENYWSLLYVGGMLTYILGMFFLVESFKTKHIAVATAIFVIVNLATLALVSWLYFGEKLTLHEAIGLVLAVVAIIFLEMRG